MMVETMDPCRRYAATVEHIPTSQLAQRVLERCSRPSAEWLQDVLLALDRTGVPPVLPSVPHLDIRPAMDSTGPAPVLPSLPHSDSPAATRLSWRKLARSAATASRVCLRRLELQTLQTQAQD